MPIWKLTPIDVTDHNWARSTHKDVAIVRAETEGAARERARYAFEIAANRKPGRDVLVTPWKYARLVTCEQLKGSEYAEEGPAGILLPEQEEEELRDQPASGSPHQER